VREIEDTKMLRENRDSHGDEDVFSPEDGGSMFLLIFGIYLQVHTALQPRRPTSAKLL
jgi:hypothetical protein